MTFFDDQSAKLYRSRRNRKPLSDKPVMLNNVYVRDRKEYSLLLALACREQREGWLIGRN